MSFHEQTSESDSLAVLDASFQLASFPFGPAWAETPMAQVLPECVLDRDWLLDYQQDWEAPSHAAALATGPNGLLVCKSAREGHSYFQA